MDIWVCLGKLGPKLKNLVLVVGDKRVSFGKFAEKLQVHNNLDSILAWQELLEEYQRQTLKGAARLRAETIPQQNSPYTHSSHRQNLSLDSAVPRSVGIENFSIRTYGQ